MINLAHLSVSCRSGTLLRGREQTGEEPVHWLQQGGPTCQPLQRGCGGHRGTAADPAHQRGETCRPVLAATEQLLEQRSNISCRREGLIITVHVAQRYVKMFSGVVFLLMWISKKKSLKAQCVIFENLKINGNRKWLYFRLQHCFTHPPSPKFSC